MLKIISVISLLASATACMSTYEGIKIVNNREATVSADSFVKSGDRVSIYEDRCNLPFKAKTRQCWPEKIGDGKVVNVSNQRALVRTDETVNFTKNAYVKWSYEP